VRVAPLPPEGVERLVEKLLADLDMEPLPLVEKVDLLPLLGSTLGSSAL
jgi:hypothetical protein